MKIRLIGPYAKLWKKGYLRVAKKDGRRRVDLVNDHKTDRSTVAFARYVMSIAYGQIIPDEYDVDHIDRDCSNDLISNLQVITKEAHRTKTGTENRKPPLVLVCPQCKHIFEQKRNQRAEVKGYKFNFCSRTCSGKFNRNDVLPSTSFTCPQCGVRFSRFNRQLHSKTKRRFCSKSCSTTFYRSSR